MIRFEPDTWQDAALRFFAMAAPDANVYVEIAAPDLRFAALVLIAAGAAIFHRRLSGRPRPAVALLVVLLASSVIWLVTSGNGRYFMPMLLCIGPLVAGLVYLLPLSRGFRLFIAGGLFAAQTFVVMQSSPWDTWAWLPWGEAGYFPVEVPKSDAAEAPTTYVTLTSISYSLIAPQFPPSSRWMNITTVGALDRDRQWGQEFLRAAKGPLKLVVPSIPGQTDADGKPAPGVLKAIDELLGPQRIGLEESSACDFVASQGMAAIVGKRRAATKEPAPVGFWICPLRFPVDRPPSQTQPIPEKTEATFGIIEKTCPRFFPPGSAKTMRISGGALRHYPDSDMKVYVLDSGEVLYKFWRALNPVVIGTVDRVVTGVDTVHCDHIRGRSGLPWDREI
jgi:hypothetical protein